MADSFEGICDVTDKVRKKISRIYKGYSYMYNKKVLSRLYGHNTSRGISLWFMLIAAIAVVGLMGVGGYFIYLEAGSDGLLFLIPLGIVVFVIIFLFAKMIVDSNKHRNMLKSKFLSLPEDTKAEVYNMAKSYKGNTVCCNGKYVYGNLSAVKNARVKLKKVVGFEYISMSEIKWVHLLEASMAMPVGYAGGVGARRLTQYEICVYTDKNKCYKGFCDKNLITEIGEIVKQTNPDCHVGYSKEYEKDFFSKK